MTAECSNDCMAVGTKKLKPIKTITKIIVGITVQTPASPLGMSSLASPKIITVTCLRMPANTSANASKAIITITGKRLIPADNIENSVIKIPKGGTPAIVRNPTQNKILVIGNVLIIPCTLTILVELYFNKMLPADKNKDDFARE